MLSNAGDISIYKSNPPNPRRPSIHQWPVMRSKSYLFLVTFINGLSQTAIFITLFVLTVPDKINTSVSMDFLT